MSYTNAMHGNTATSEIAVASENPQVSEHGSLPASSCEQDPLQSAGRVPAARSIPSPDQNPLEEARADATSGTSIDGEARGAEGAAIHVMHGSMQIALGSFKIYVTDTEAESMICHNGSVDGDLNDEQSSKPDGSFTRPDLRFPFYVTPPSVARILEFTEETFDAGLLVDRKPRISSALDIVEVCFPS